MCLGRTVADLSATMDINWQRYTLPNDSSTLILNDRSRVAN